MEAFKLVVLIFCVLAVLSVVPDSQVEAKPRGYNVKSGSRRHACRSRNDYACMVSGGRKGRPVCISTQQLCNGRCDCPMGDDEHICKYINPTATYTRTSTVMKTVRLTINTTLTTPSIAYTSTAILSTTTACPYQHTFRSTYSLGVSIPVGQEVCSTYAAEVPNNPDNNHYTYTHTDVLRTTTFTQSLTCGPTTLYPI